MKTLYVITGPAGVGKSTISEGVAKMLEKSALVEGDYIYHQVIGGYVSAWLKGAPKEVFWKNNISLINNYLDYDYDVVFNYIIYKKDLNYIKENVKGVKIKFIVLLTDEETIIKRDTLRSPENRMNERSVLLLNKLIEEKYNDNNILYTSDLSVEQTIEEILSNDRFYL